MKNVAKMSLALLGLGMGCVAWAGAETALVPLACQDLLHLKVDKSILDKPLTIAGRTFASGYGAHGTSLIPFDIPHAAGIMDFCGSVGIDDDEDKIEGDGVEFVVSDGSSVLWKSGRMKRGDAARSFSVLLKPGIKRVYLQTYAGADNWSDHCDWCDLKLYPSTFEPSNRGVSYEFVPNPCESGGMVRSSISGVRETGRPGKLTFRKGVYHFYASTAHQLSFHVSNNDHPAVHPVALPLVGLKDVTIDGGGSKFILHGSVVAALVMDSENVTIKGIDFEYAESENFDVTVTGFEPGKTRVKIDEKRFPYEIEKDSRRILFTGAGGLKMPISSCMAFDGVTHEIIERTSDIGLPRTGTRLDDGTLVLDRDVSKLGAGVKVGDVLSLRNCGRDNPAIVLYRAKNTVLEDVIVRNSFGMALVAQRSENITFRGTKKAADRTAGMFAGEGRVGSVSADATHFSNCRGEIRVENCFFEAMMDDAINVHSTCLSVREKKAPNRIRCRYMHGQSIGFETFLPGETLRFVKGPTLENGWEVKVKKVFKLDERELELVLDADVPSDYGVGDAVENADYQPSVTFVGNIVTHNRARGCLFTTPKRVVVKDNLFETISGAAILFAGDAQGWYESGACEDVLVENNVFRNNLTSRFQFTNGILSVYPEVRRLGSQKKAYHRNLVFRKNRFETFDVPLLYAKSVEGLVFEDNEIVYDTKSRYKGWGQKPFLLNRVTGFSQTGNKVTGRPAFTAADVQQVTW